MDKEELYKKHGTFRGVGSAFTEFSCVERRKSRKPRASQRTGSQGNIFESEVVQENSGGYLNCVKKKEKSVTIKVEDDKLEFINKQEEILNKVVENITEEKAEKKCENSEGEKAKPRKRMKKSHSSVRIKSINSRLFNSNKCGKPMRAFGSSARAFNPYASTGYIGCKQRPNFSRSSEKSPENEQPAGSLRSKTSEESGQDHQN